MSLKAFDVLAWVQIKPNTPHTVDGGRIKVKVSTLAALYVQQMGVEVLYGVGHEFDLTVSGEAEFTVKAPKDADVVFYNPAAKNYVSEGEKFTNTDRKPMESGTLLEVKKSLRQMALQHRDFMRAAKGERDAIERAKRDGQSERDEKPLKEETLENKKPSKKDQVIEPESDDETDA